MAKLTAVEYLSLDGVMQAPGRPDEDTRGGFARGGWSTGYFAKDPKAAMASMDGSANTAAMVFGHRTYDDLVGHWLSTTDPNPFTEVLRSTPKYVASRHPDTELPHPNSHLLEGDAIDAVRALKASITGGDLVILGSGELVRGLAAAGLIDEYILSILPVVLGSGTRLFDETYAPMEVVKSMTSETGIVVATYRVMTD